MKQIHARTVERLKRVYEAGVMIAFGTAVMIDLANETRRALAMGYIYSFVEAGISAKVILQIMTIKGAKVIGIEKERGLIAKGMYAGIIATSDYPLDNIQTLKQISFVMKNGVVSKDLNVR